MSRNKQDPHYANKTWCIRDDCAKFKKCEDALTKGIKEAAVMWWGNEEAPVKVYQRRRKCWTDATK